MRYDYDYDGEDDDYSISKQRWREHLAWLSAGPCSYWYDSADPWDGEEEEDETSNNEENNNGN